MGAAWHVGAMLATAAAGMFVAQLFRAAGVSRMCPAVGVAGWWVVLLGCEAR